MGANCIPEPCGLYPHPALQVTFSRTREKVSSCGLRPVPGERIERGGTKKCKLALSIDGSLPAAPVLMRAVAWGHWSGRRIFLCPESGMIENWYLYYLA